MKIANKQEETRIVEQLKADGFNFNYSYQPSQFHAGQNNQTGFVVLEKGKISKVFATYETAEGDYSGEMKTYRGKEMYSNICSFAEKKGVRLA